MTPDATLPPALCEWLAERGPSPREADVVRCYYDLRSKGDGVIGPSQREIAEALGISRVSVNMHCTNLVRKGVFANRPSCRSGLRLLFDEPAADGGKGNLRCEVRRAVAVLRHVAGEIDDMRPSVALTLKDRADRLEAAAAGRDAK